MHSADAQAVSPHISDRKQRRGCNAYSVSTSHSPQPLWNLHLAGAPVEPAKPIVGRPSARHAAEGTGRSRLPPTTPAPTARAATRAEISTLHTERRPQTSPKPRLFAAMMRAATRDPPPHAALPAVHPAPRPASPARSAALALSAAQEGSRTRVAATTSSGRVFVSRAATSQQPKPGPVGPQASRQPVRRDSGATLGPANTKPEQPGKQPLRHPGTRKQVAKPTPLPVRKSIVTDKRTADLVRLQVIRAPTRQLVPLSTSRPAPKPAPHPTPHPKPHLQPHGKPHTVLRSAPHPAPHPKPHAKPHTAPHPAPHPKPHAKPHTAPHSAPHAKPHPKPHAAPHAKPHLAPTRRPTPRPTNPPSKVRTKARPARIGPQDSVRDEQPLT